MSRRDLALALPIAPAAAIWLEGVVPMLREESDGWWTLLLVWGVALVAALCAGASLAIALAVNRAAARSRVAVATAIACGLLVATPVNLSWNDGCNEHGGRVALVASPYVLLATPADVGVPYTDSQTLMLCG